jgi:hypothetical protein
MAVHQGWIRVNNLCIAFIFTGQTTIEAQVSLQNDLLEVFFNIIMCEQKMVLEAQ